MYTKLNLPADAGEAAAIERRKNKEKQRQARIFNARERTMGVSSGIEQLYLAMVQAYKNNFLTYLLTL